MMSQLLKPGHGSSCYAICDSGGCRKEPSPRKVVSCLALSGLVVWSGLSRSLNCVLFFLQPCLFLQSCDVVVPVSFLSLAPLLLSCAHFLVVVCVPTWPRELFGKMGTITTFFYCLQTLTITIRISSVALFSADKTECLNQPRSNSLDLSLSIAALCAQTGRQIRGWIQEGVVEGKIL